MPNCTPEEARALKYWRGYLTAAIFAFFSWALLQFAAANTVLIDMVYPYVTRTLQTYLADWTGGAAFCLWQVLVALGIALVLASAVLMILLKWNPVQWFGWVTAAISIVFFLHTGLYGMNQYAGTVANDIRLTVTEYTLSELEDAAAYFRDNANALVDQVERDSSGKIVADFDTLAQQAAEGFNTLVYEDSYSIYAGSTVPVKKLGFAKRYTKKGVTGVTVALTGEAAVNPQTPTMALPYAMCTEMAKRMCVAELNNAKFSAYLACRANSSAQFQYAAYCMAYRTCYDTLLRIGSDNAIAAANRVKYGISDKMQADLQTYEKFLKEKVDETQTCQLLVSWYVQEIVLPTQTEEESKFDPYDETHVDLTGIVNAKTNG